MDLKEMLGEELFDQVKEKLGDKELAVVNDGSYIPRAKFDTVNNDKKELQDQLKERDKQLDELKAKAKDSEELLTQISDLQEQNKKVAEEYETKLSEQNFNFAVEQAIAKQEAKNVKAVKALLDTGKMKLDGDTLIGFDEQMTAIKESEPYLFGKEVKGKDPHKTNDTAPPQKNPWTPENFNLTEQGRLLKEDPDTAERMKAAAGH